MIPVYRDEIPIRPARADLTLQLHGKIKCYPSKVGHFSTRYLFRFVHIFLKIFLCKDVLINFFITLR